MRDRISPVTTFSLKDWATAETLVAFNAGPDGAVHLVFALHAPDYEEQHGFAVFPKVCGAVAQDYRIVTIRDAAVVWERVVTNEAFNIHEVQPVGEHLLLACARSEHRADSGADLNGRLYANDGTLIKELLLGDGVQTIQATCGGEIWVSYFDEGIYGNFGWGSSFGAAGLVALDAAGTKIFEYEPKGELGPIDDCYALNVVSESDAWCCYYTDFPLVRLHNKQIEASWNVPVKGSPAFAVDGEYVLFAGGYEHRDKFELVRLQPDGSSRLLGRLPLVDADDNVVQPERIVGRGDRLFVISGQMLYEISLQSVRG